MRTNKLVCVKINYLIKGELIFCIFAKESPVRMKHHCDIFIMKGDIKLVMLSEFIVKR